LNRACGFLPPKGYTATSKIGRWGAEAFQAARRQWTQAELLQAITGAAAKRGRVSWALTPRWIFANLEELVLEGSVPPERRPAVFREGEERRRHEAAMDRVVEWAD